MQTTLNFKSAGYFNTTKLEGSHLAEKQSKAKSQEQQVLNIFIAHNDLDFTRDEICEKLKDACPTSIGRAITNLKNANVLEKTNTRRLGHIYGATQFTYKLIV